MNTYMQKSKAKEVTVNEVYFKKEKICICHKQTYVKAKCNKNATQYFM